MTGQATTIAGAEYYDWFMRALLEGGTRYEEDSPVHDGKPLPLRRARFRAEGGEWKTVEEYIFHDSESGLVTRTLRIESETLDAPTDIDIDKPAQI